MLLFSSAAISEEPDAVNLLEARKGFQTKHVAYVPDEEDVYTGVTSVPAPAPPAGVYDMVHFDSPIGKLVAYVTPDPGDGKKHPALLWAGNSFGIDESDWEKGSDTPSVFRAAGMVVMCPSFRGGNDNPGHYEMFMGEIDDAMGALDYLKSLPYVDRNRIYMLGYSEGGTITLLTAMARPDLRAAFSFTGALDIDSLVSDGVGYTPFPHDDERERFVRSPLSFVGTLEVPTWNFVGTFDTWSFLFGDFAANYRGASERMAELARSAGAPFRSIAVEGGGRTDFLAPLCKMLVEKIELDTGEKCSIDISAKDVELAFAQTLRAIRAERRREHDDKNRANLRELQNAGHIQDKKLDMLIVVQFKRTQDADAFQKAAIEKGYRIDKGQHAETARTDHSQLWLGFELPANLKKITEMTLEIEELAVKHGLRFVRCL